MGKRRARRDHVSTPKDDSELNQLLNRYLEIKMRYREMPLRAPGRKRLKREYQRLERGVISAIPSELRYREYVLIKGFNEYGEHIQVFTEKSLQRRRNHQEVVTVSIFDAS